MRSRKDAELRNFFTPFCAKVAQVPACAAPRSQGIMDVASGNRLQHFADLFTNLFYLLTQLSHLEN